MPRAVPPKRRLGKELYLASLPPLPHGQTNVIKWHARDVEIPDIIEAERRYSHDPKTVRR